MFLQKVAVKEIAKAVRGRNEYTKEDIKARVYQPIRALNNSLNVPCV